jgi:hypothetical protein
MACKHIDKRRFTDIGPSQESILRLVRCRATGKFFAADDVFCFQSRW